MTLDVEVMVLVDGVGNARIHQRARTIAATGRLVPDHTMQRPADPNWKPRPCEAALSMDPGPITFRCVGETLDVGGIRQFVYRQMVANRVPKPSIRSYGLNTERVRT